MQIGGRDAKPRIAAALWVQAVTDAAITNGMIWSVVVSSLFATISVYVFTGSVRIVALATVTMAGINVLVLGLYSVLGWRLGAIEGVSITVLVGLSVDFSIHFSEAFISSPLDNRKNKARCALLLLLPFISTISRNDKTARALLRLPPSNHNAATTSTSNRSQR